MLLTPNHEFLNHESKAMNTNQTDPGCCTGNSGCCGNITDFGCCQNYGAVCLETASF
jgi:hypothetical protein